jgi:hypothetical protein
MGKTITKKDILAHDLLKKGHVHKEKIELPEACKCCGGSGYIFDNGANGITFDDIINGNECDISTVCLNCEGEGITWETSRNKK